MEVESFTDLLDDGPPRRVHARVAVRTPAEGGRDIPSGVHYRPNHNFGGPANRSFYIGQVDVPPGGLIAGRSSDVEVTFLHGPGLDELLVVGRKWRIQEGGKWIASAELLEMP